MSSEVDRSSPDAVQESLDAYHELGVGECLLDAAASDLAEIGALLEVLAQRD